MIAAAIAFFSLAALLGLLLLSFVLRGKETPKAVVFTHGPLAVTGLVLLLIYAFNHKPGPLEAIIAFMVAALGGFVLVFRDLTGKPVPKWLAVVHGLVAVTGFILLVIFAMSPANV
jgi:hypothetical protein